MFRTYGDDAVIQLIENVSSREYTAKMLEIDNVKVNVITCKLLDSKGNVLVEIPITCTENVPTQNQLKKIVG